VSSWATRNVEKHTVPEQKSVCQIAVPSSHEKHAASEQKSVCQIAVPSSHEKHAASEQKRVCQIAVPSSHEECETIIDVTHLDLQGAVADVPSAMNRGRLSLPVTSASKKTQGGRKSFSNVLEQWRVKSDDKPNSHFLSPKESDVLLSRETNLFSAKSYVTPKESVSRETNIFSAKSYVTPKESDAPMSREPNLCSAETSEIAQEASLYNTESTAITRESNPCNAESPVLVNDTPVENSIEPASSFPHEQSEPGADFEVPKQAGPDSSENFYHQAIKYHEKPGAQADNKGKKDPMKRQSMEIYCRPLVEGKESTRRKSYGGIQQTKQQRPVIETSAGNPNKGPTTQASKIKAAYNKQRRSIEQPNKSQHEPKPIEQPKKSQHEPNQHQSKARGDEITKSQHESDFRRQKSPPRSRVDFKTAIQTALRERVPDLEPKRDLHALQSLEGGQVDDRKLAGARPSGAQGRSRSYSDAQKSCQVVPANKGQDDHRRAPFAIMKSDSGSSADAYSYSVAPKRAAPVPLRDLVIKEGEDAGYDRNGNPHDPSIPFVVEVEVDDRGIALASSVDDESIDERRIQKPISSRNPNRSAPKPEVVQDSPWREKLAQNLDEGKEDDKRIGQREDTFSERPWRRDLVIESVKSYGEQSTQSPTQVESGECHCSNSVFSGNDELVDFFLPLMGMACTCGKRPQLLENPEEPTALENILRPWQVDFLGAFGICRGDQLVKAQHRSGKALATALRQYRRKQNMTAYRTKSCGMAIQIWAKTCKAFVRSIRHQLLTGTNEIKLPNTLYILSSFLERMPGEAADGTHITHMSMNSSLCSSNPSPRELDDDDFSEI
jgi:hypothetical protein